MVDQLEDHEIIDDWIGDVACYSMGCDIECCEMEADIDGEWVKVAEVRAAILKKVKACEPDGSGHRDHNRPVRRLASAALRLANIAEQNTDDGDLWSECIAEVRRAVMAVVSDQESLADD